MDINGNFYLGGTSGTLRWNELTGTLVIAAGGDAYSPSSAGLFLTATHFGYHDGSNWTAYIQSDGTFKFAGSADDYLEWDGATLTLAGTFVCTDKITFTVGAANKTILGIHGAYYATASLSASPNIFWGPTSLALHGGLTDGNAVTIGDITYGTINLLCKEGSVTHGINFNFGGTSVRFMNILIAGGAYANYTGYLTVRIAGATRIIPFI